MFRWIWHQIVRFKRGLIAPTTPPADTAALLVMGAEATEVTTMEATAGATVGAAMVVAAATAGAPKCHAALGV